MDIDDIEVDEQTRVLTIKDWVIIQIILAIPFVNIIMLIKWLVSKNTNKNLKNLIIAAIIMFAITLMSMILFFGSFSNIDFSSIGY